MRSLAAAALAVLLVASPGVAQRQQQPPQRELVTYVCDGRVQMPGAPPATLSLTKVFLEDGSVHHQSVELYQDAGFIRSREPGDRITISLKWPAENLYRPTPAPFSWAEGSIRITLLTQAAFRHERREVWQLTFIYISCRAMI
jgi:hypothetical protein